MRRDKTPPERRDTCRTPLEILIVPIDKRTELAVEHLQCISVKDEKVR